MVDEASRLSMKTPTFLVEKLLQALEKHLSNNKALRRKADKGKLAWLCSAVLWPSWVDPSLVDGVLCWDSIMAWLVV